MQIDSDPGNVIYLIIRIGKELIGKEESRDGCCENDQPLGDDKTAGQRVTSGY
jgi:hypothetical protein